MPGSWTITDCDLSRNNRDLIYSSIHDTSTCDNEDFGIWSIRLSNDSKEIIAGSNGGQIFVYELNKKRLHRSRAQHDVTPSVSPITHPTLSYQVQTTRFKNLGTGVPPNDSKPPRSHWSHGRHHLYQRMMMWDMRKLLNPSPDTLRRSYSKNFITAGILPRSTPQPPPKRLHPQLHRSQSPPPRSSDVISPLMPRVIVLHTREVRMVVSLFDTESGRRWRLEPPKVRIGGGDDVFSAF
ncbi:hypothetical protein BC829DRAFT_440965 [Chytridium lagenaria]|nr:hypothetical protein BC829DRAFT_440965 [Chytridium lagenaria]